MMSINLLEKVQQNLNYAPLEKIDPNVPQEHMDIADSDDASFGQVAIPAVLTGLYKFSATDEGAKEILKGDSTTNWINKIFDANSRHIVEDIAQHLSKSINSTETQMNIIACEAIKLTQENLPKEATEKDVMHFFSDQVTTFLPYLPANLNIGAALDDTTLDDDIHKMEGPISSLMHSIGNIFSTPETKKDASHVQ